MSVRSEVSYSLASRDCLFDTRWVVGRTVYVELFVCWFDVCLYVEGVGYPELGWGPLYMVTSRNVNFLVLCS